MKLSSMSVVATSIAAAAITLVVAVANARADSADVLASGKDGGVAPALAGKDGGALQAEGVGAWAKDSGARLEALGAKDAGLTATLTAKDGGFALASGKDAGAAFGHARE